MAITSGPRRPVRPLHDYVESTWQHAEYMQEVRRLPYSDNSNLTTIRIPTAAPPTTPLYGQGRQTPLLHLPHVPRVDISSDDFIWTCDLPGCERGWMIGSRTPFWPPKYLAVYNAAGEVVDRRQACCDMHAQILKRRIVEEGMH